MMTWGATELKTLIASTPGTFALVGNGLGAMVCSAVLQEMQTGTLTNRFSDCIGAVMFGNGCRQEGKTYPGGVELDGAGILPGSSTGAKGTIRNTNTPAWWWEMAAADDPIANCPIDTSGQAVNIIADALMKTSGYRELLPTMTKIVPTLKKTNTVVWNQVAGRLTNRNANAAALLWANRVFAQNPNPHNMYAYSMIQAVPTGMEGLTGSTYVDTALAYINLRGTTIPPR